MDSMGHVVVDNKNQNKKGNVKLINAYNVTESSFKSNQDHDHYKESHSHTQGNFFVKDYMLNNNASHKHTSKKFGTPFGSFIGDAQYNIINNQKYDDK